nr:hypothetical protein [Tanacetum cinerariifolium]
ISGRQGAKISPLSPQSSNQSILSSTAVIYGQRKPNLPSSSSNRTLAHLISTCGSSQASSLLKRHVRGSIIGGGGGSGVNIGNGISDGGNGYDVGEIRDSDGVGMESNLSTFDSERNGIVGYTAAGSGCSSAGNTSSAGGRYSGYSGPGM